MTRLKEEIDQLYISMTKGAFIRFRAKWLEEAEMNTSYYFALEKKANHTFQFYSDLYSSNYKHVGIIILTLPRTRQS